MHAVVEIAGKQFKVTQKRKVVVPLLSEKKGSKVTFDKVLLVQDDKTVKVGNPTVKGATVEATVLGEHRADKILVLKKKKRKGYRVRNGHRQAYTELEIDTIANQD